MKTFLISVLFLIIMCGSSFQAQTKPNKDYLVYVLSEAADKISLIRFGPGGARVGQQIDTGEMPVDLDGPHGIAVSPDREFYYVSIAHGRPFGSVWKYSTKDNSLSRKPHSVTFLQRWTSRLMETFSSR